MSVEDREKKLNFRFDFQSVSSLKHSLSCVNETRLMLGAAATPVTKKHAYHIGTAREIDTGKFLEEFLLMNPLNI